MSKASNTASVLLKGPCDEHPIKWPDPRIVFTVIGLPVPQGSKKVVPTPAGPRARMVPSNAATSHRADWCR